MIALCVMIFIAVTENEKMADYIDRQAAYEALTDYYHHRTEIQHTALHDALNKVPTAQGRWEYVDYGGVGNYHCSRCRAIGKKDYEFCPRCGARMDCEHDE